MGNGNRKSLEAWIWDAACSIRGAKDAAKFKEFILPLIFTKRLCDVFDEFGQRAGKISLVRSAGLLNTRPPRSWPIRLFGSRCGAWTEQWERDDEDHSIFACSGMLGYHCFGSAALKSSKFGREPFHCGKYKDRVRNGRILLSPSQPTQGCPLGLW